MVNGTFKDDLVDAIKESMDTKFGRPLDEQNMAREGTDNLAELAQTQVDDMFTQSTGIDTASSNFFPVQLDPNVYDQASLYQRTPVLSYLEAKGRRSPASTTKFNFIELSTGFASEWFSEMDGTVGTTLGATDLGTAQICFEAVPFNLSDLLGAGQTVTTRAQLLGYIQETLREGYENVLLNGSYSSSSGKQFDGLFTSARANGVKKDASNGAVSLDAMRGLHADLRQKQKGFASFIVTDEYSHVDIQKEMAATIRNINTVDGIIAGVNPTAFQASAAEIPIIVSPYAPMTIASPDTADAVPTARSLGMFNEQYINIQDLITPSFVEAGKTKPLATNGWVVQASTMYNTVPKKCAVLYDIDL